MREIPEELAVEGLPSSPSAEFRHGWRMAQAGIHDSPISALLPLAVAEAEKAMRKFPQPNYTISKFSEEAGEVHKALIHKAEDRYDTEKMFGEIVQMLAMLHRLMIEGDQVHGLAPLMSFERAAK